VDGFDRGERKREKRKEVVERARREGEKISVPLQKRGRAVDQRSAATRHSRSSSQDLRTTSFFAVRDEARRKRTRPRCGRLVYPLRTMLNKSLLLSRGTKRGGVCSRVRADVHESVRGERKEGKDGQGEMKRWRWER